MEFTNADIRLTLKSSCDACTASKVKCSGEDPCSRCVKKGFSCFYSPKKKRGPVKKRNLSSIITNEPASAKDPSLHSLGSHERRSWSVFFTLYKHYGVSCSLFWFNRQLFKMRQYLLKQKNTEALKRLSSWMEALNIDVEELGNMIRACNLKVNEMKRDSEGRKHIAWDEEETAKVLNSGSGPFFLRVNNGGESDSDDNGLRFVSSQINQGSVATSESYEVNFHALDNSAGADPALRFIVDYARPGSDTKVIVNNSFVEFMGYGVERISNDLRKSGGGFLPWGGDVLARILVNESDLLSFVQILAIKFNSMGRPTEYPIIRSMPSVHLFKINHKDVAVTGPKEVVMKCTHREVIADNESSLYVSITFTSTDPVGSPLRVSHFDFDSSLIEDNVQLPPKRARQSYARTQHEVIVDLPGDDESPGGKIYNYNGAMAEMNAAMKSDTPMHPHLSDAAQHNVDLGADNMNGFREQFDESFLEADGAFLDDMTFGEENNGENIPSPSAIDDSAWLDELLTWTGQPHTINA